MKDFCCAICSNTFSGNYGNKYCSVECRHEATKLRRRNGIKVAARKRETDKRCVSCGRTFVSHNSCKIYCTDECRVNSGNASRRKIAAIKRDVPKANCCICGSEFDLFYVKTVTCRDKECIKSHALNMKHKRIAEGATYKLSDGGQQRKDLERTHQLVDAICPGCGIIHKHRFEPAWIGNGTPRKKCKRYPACMSKDISGLSRLVRNEYQDTFETDNRAII